MGEKFEWHNFELNNVIALGAIKIFMGAGVGVTVKELEVGIVGGGVGVIKKSFQKTS